MNQNDAENFNGQMRDFGETASQLVNYILLVSAGILSVTIGAFLAKPPPLSPSELVWIRWGWGLLTTSMVCTLLSFCMLMIAKRLVIQGVIKRMKATATGLILVQGSTWFRWVIAVVFLVGFAACIAGIICIAYGASGLLHSGP